MARVRSGGWVAAAWGVCLLGGVVGGLSMEPAQASESGTSVYLLCSGGPGTAMMPPVKGVFFANTLYYYSGSAGAERRILYVANLPMLIKLASVRQTESLDQAAQSAQEAGRKYINVASQVLQG